MTRFTYFRPTLVANCISAIVIQIILVIFNGDCFESICHHFYMYNFSYVAFAIIGLVVFCFF